MFRDNIQLFDTYAAEHEAGMVAMYEDLEEWRWWREQQWAQKPVAERIAAKEAIIANQQHTEALIDATRAAQPLMVRLVNCRAAADEPLYTLRPNGAANEAWADAQLRAQWRIVQQVWGIEALEQGGLHISARVETVTIGDEEQVA